jgi:cell division GTPase FtsZ|tara:strand:+ start:394 stop:1542 length:1149 start_codon:yes stop_codon:yes gene_type:complete
LKPLIIGLGRAGCRIASLFLNKGNFPGIIFDTDQSELNHHKNKYRILLGEDVLDGNGTGKNFEIGTNLMAREIRNIMGRLDSIKEEVDCYLVIAGLGGGTGGAVGDLLKELNKEYTEPVYFVGVLPSKDDHPIVMSNFTKSFKNAWNNCDAFFPIDNDSLKSDLQLRGAYKIINESIYAYLSALFEIGEYNYRNRNKGSILSTSDVINTLSGLTSIGLANSDFKVSAILEDEKTNIDRADLIVSLTKEAVKKLLLPEGVDKSQKALVVVIGPKKYLDFIGSIPARLWVEKNIEGIEVRGGDLLLHRHHGLGVMVLISGINKSNRIKQLYQIGKTQLVSDEFSERIANTFNRLDYLKDTLTDVEKEFGKFYNELKGLKDDEES